MTTQQYVTDGKLSVCMERVGKTEYEQRDDIRARFEVFDGDTALCGNVRAVFDTNGKATLKGDGIPAYEQISSALALYRCISLFETGVNNGHADFYKMNWMITVKHQDTGEYLGLGEWKGGFQIFTRAHTYSDLPKSFIEDVEQLLTFLVSPTMPIGYDGTVAGSVA